MLKVQERYRWKDHPIVSSSEDDGCNGFFIIPHYRINGYEFRCQVSNGMGWEHLSVTVAKIREQATRTPTWTEMCWLKNMFWDENDACVQYHPPKYDYVNLHEFCLHIWRPTEKILPLPPKEFVG